MEYFLLVSHLFILHLDILFVNKPSSGYTVFMRCLFPLSIVFISMLSIVAVAEAANVINQTGKSGVYLLKKDGQAWNVYYLKPPSIQPARRAPINGDAACGPFFYLYGGRCYCKLGYKLDPYKQKCLPDANAATFEACSAGVCTCPLTARMNGDGNGCETLPMYNTTDELPCINHRKPCLCQQGYEAYGNRICKRVK
jgi:hypothetical protein